MTETFLNYLSTHPTLIPGILKSCHVYKTQTNYEDYSQEVYLLLWSLWQKVQGEEKIFAKLAFTHGRCRLLDRMRYDLRRENPLVAIPEDFDLPFYEAENNLPEFFTVLTDFEKELCQALIEEDSLTAAAKKLNISRNKIYRSLPELRKKARLYLGKNF